MNNLKKNGVKTFSKMIGVGRKYCLVNWRNVSYMLAVVLLFLFSWFLIWTTKKDSSLY